MEALRADADAPGYPQTWGTPALREAVAAWFANTLNAVLAGLTLVVFCGFASLAWKVILEDYVPQAGARRALVLLVNLICLVLAAAGVFFITRMALGSAPLPAGFGA